MKKQKQKRGELTRRVADKAKETLGREITLSELRLMPYVHYVSMNEQIIVPNKINDAERDILNKWEAEGWLTTDRKTTTRYYPLTVTKKFYDAACAILWLAYVDIKREE